MENFRRVRRQMSASWRKGHRTKHLKDSSSYSWKVERCAGEYYKARAPNSPRRGKPVKAKFCKRKGGKTVKEPYRDMNSLNWRASFNNYITHRCKSRATSHPSQHSLARRHSMAVQWVPLSFFRCMSTAHSLGILREEGRYNSRSVVILVSS